MSITKTPTSMIDPNGATDGQVLTFNASTSAWGVSAIPKELPSSATAGQVLTYNGSTSTWVASATVSKSAAFVAKAWVNFDATTTPPSIRSSFNVSSITRNSTGDFTINFTNPMVDANYCFTVGGGSATDIMFTGPLLFEEMYSQTTNQISFKLTYGRLSTGGGSSSIVGNQLNASVVSVIIFGN